MSRTRTASVGELASVEVSAIGRSPPDSSDDPEADEFGAFGYLAVCAFALHEKSGRTSPWSECLADFK